jgi:hypothetical protein
MAESTSTPAGTGAIGTSEAAEQIANLSDDVFGDEPEAPAKKRKVPAPAAEGADEDEAESEEDGDEEEPETDEEDADEEKDEDDDSAEDEDEEEESEDDENQLIPVKVDGKVEKVTLEELKKGYSRTKTFTQRTQEAAERSKAAESLRAEVEQERAIVAQVAADLRARLEQTEQEPDWDALRESDPVEWSIQRQVWADKQSERERLKNVERELQRRNQEAQSKRFQETLTKERESLFEKVPEWKEKPELATKELAKIRTLMVSELDFTEEEADRVYDHRAVLALRDAVRFRDLIKRQAKLAKEGKPAKVVEKVLTPGSGKTKMGAAAERKQAMETLRKSGSTHDAARAISMIPGLL